jgi:hypothetical protein
VKSLRQGKYSTERTPRRGAFLMGKEQTTAAVPSWRLVIVQWIDAKGFLFHIMELAGLVVFVLLSIVSHSDLRKEKRTLVLSTFNL